jgi:CheY-like chemotaxis protein
MDDEEILRELLTQMLQCMGYTVECAAQGEEALGACLRAKDQGLPFALLVLDLTIPGGMGGRETIRRIRQEEIDTLAIASSGYSSDPIMADPLAYGFAAAIPKPYDIFELHHTIQAVIATKGPSAS